MESNSCYYGILQCAFEEHPIRGFTENTLRKTQPFGIPRIEPKQNCQRNCGNAPGGRDQVRTQRPWRMANLVSPAME
jgi:hypothetical protein